MIRIYYVTRGLRWFGFRKFLFRKAERTAVGGERGNNGQYTGRCESTIETCFLKEKLLFQKTMIT